MSRPGHTGAAAALLVLAAGAACCAAAAARREPVRLTLRLLALGAACAASALHSVAGFATALGVLLSSLAAVRMRRRLLGLTGLALVTALIVGTSWAVAADALPDGLMVSLEGQLTRNRVLLWQDAVDLAEEHPLLGHRARPVRRTQPHRPADRAVGREAPLGAAAAGRRAGDRGAGAAGGGVRLAAVRAVAFTPRSTAVVLTAGSALTALAALASVGNVLSFTPVTAGVGLLAGLASARQPIGDGTPDTSRTDGDEDADRAACGTGTAAGRRPGIGRTPL
ncbi:hypothetical protein GCM10018966_014310 [Streptomyces yanii]